MLARLSKGLAQRGKPALKFRFDVQIDKLENLPAAVKKCRVVWSRGSKLQMTDIREVASGTAKFGQTLTAVATLYKDPVKGFEPKEYSFKVQVPAKEGASKMYTVGRADIDMAMYATADKATSATKMVPIIFKIGATTTGYLKISVASEMVASGTGGDDDALTAVSGLTGIHSMEGSDFAEQDLAGFDESTPERSRSPAVPVAPRASPASVRRLGRLSGTPSGLRAASEARSDGSNGGGGSGGSREEDEEVNGPPAVAAAAASARANPARSAPVAVPTAAARASSGGQRGPAARGRGRAAADKDDDVSEMSVSPEAEPVERPGARAGQAASTAAPGRLQAAPGTTAFERPLAATAVQKKPEKYEGELKPLLRDAKAILAGKIGAAITAARSAGSSRRGSAASGAAEDADEGEEGEEGPSAGVRGGPPSASRARLSEVLAVAQERQRERQRERDGASANPVPEASSGRAQAALAEDEARSALFGTGGGSGGRKGPAKQGAAKASGEQPGKSEDERAELFGAPAKGTAKTAAAGRQPLLLGRTALPPAKPRAEADEEGGTDDEAGAAPAPAASRPRHAGLAAGAAERQQQLQREQLQREQLQREQQQQKRAGQQEQQHEHLRAENEKLRAQLSVLRDQMTAGEDARRQAQLREDRLASERDEFRQQAEELEERLKEAERQQANDGRAAEAAAEAAEQRRRAEGLRARVEELEGRCRALEREGAELKRRLADESEDRTALEAAVRDRLEETGDDAAVEAVAGWEAKYARLKARYREVQGAAREEIDALHEELDRAHEALGALEQQVAQLEAFKSAATKGEAMLERSAEASSRTAADLAAARREAGALTSELVSRKLELAQLAEREVIARRELYKAREANMKLASRLTRMEAQLVSGRR